MHDICHGRRRYRFWDILALVRVGSSISSLAVKITGYLLTTTCRSRTS